MSTINDDKKPLKKRREKLDGVEVPLREQIPAKLAAKLEKMAIGQKVVDLWNKGDSNRSVWLDKQLEFEKDLDVDSNEDSQGPFSGSSSLHIPMPLTVLKTMHARMVQALLPVDEPLHVKSRNQASEANRQYVQDVMTYTVKDWTNEGDGVEAEADAWLWDVCGKGSGILKARWDRQYERFVDVVVEEELRPMKTINPLTGEIIETSRKVPVEKEKIRQVLCVNCPKVQRKDLEAVVMIGGKGDPQKADAVIEKYQVTASKAWTLVDQKLFVEDAVEEMIDGGKDYEHEILKAEQDAQTGIEDQNDDSKHDRYTVLEAYLNVDVDGSGIHSKVVVWVHPRSRRILRATYLRRLSPQGVVPFFKADFIRKPDQVYGVGVLEMLHSLSVEMDAMHNMRIDFGLLAAMPYGFYRPTSSIEPKTLPLEPGVLIPLDDPQRDVYFPNLGNRTATLFQEEAAIQTMVERLTGMNDLTYGAITGAQGATRTATGTRALQAESSVNLAIPLRNIRRAWRRCMRYVFTMVQEKKPVGISFAVTGEDGNNYWRTIDTSTHASLMGDFDFDISANSEDSNPQVVAQKADLSLQQAQDMLAIQLGIVSPSNYYEAKKNWFRAMGIKDYGRFITKPADYQLTLSPEEEASRVLRGIPVQVSLQGDHQGFVAYVQALLSEDEVMGQLAPQAAAALQAQVQKHMEMAQALQQMQAQSANRQQVATNTGLSGIASGPMDIGPVTGGGSGDGQAA